MFKQAFLEAPGVGPLRYEEQLLRTELERRQIPVSFFTQKRIKRRQLQLSDETFVAGSMDVMHGAMSQLKITIPTANDYPESLRPFMHRAIWTSTLGAVERSMLEDQRAPVFVKPSDRRKSFTGRIFSSSDDFREIGSISRQQAVWCSEVVAWSVEFRVYVIGERIVSIDRYSGDTSVALDRTVLNEALSMFRASGEAPSAYGIDFGVLASGQTALVEANDGYSLGAYQIGGIDYTDLLLTRWSELLSLTQNSHPA